VSELAPPVDVGRDAARRAAAEELSRNAYEQESLLERAWRWFQELLDQIFAQAAEGGLSGLVSLVILVVVLAALTAVLLWSLRRMSRSARARTAGVFGAREQTAAEHRAAAERLASEGRWPEAVRERLRAIARTLEEREILAALPGRTADELAAAAGHALPDLRDRLAAAARLFDAVTYGEDPGSAEGYAAVADLDQQIVAAEPVAVAP
jgi:hypothetical protein